MSNAAKAVVYGQLFVSWYLADVTTPPLLRLFGLDPEIWWWFKWPMMIIVYLGLLVGYVVVRYLYFDRRGQA